MDGRRKRDGERGYRGTEKNLSRDQGCIFFAFKIHVSRTLILGEKIMFSPLSHRQSMFQDKMDSFPPPTTRGKGVVVGFPKIYTPMEFFSFSMEREVVCIIMYKVVHTAV